MSGRVSYLGGIVKDGLILDLDAGKLDSYNRLGTTWNDISGNRNNGTLTNFSSPSPQTIWNGDNGGGIIFDGTNDYISSFPQQISDINSKTIEVWFRTTTTVRTGLCGTTSSTGVNGWSFLVNRTTAGNLTYFHNGGTILQVTAGILNNVWYQACVTYNSITAIGTLYLNGTQIGTPLGSFTSMGVSSYNGIIGNEDQLLTSPFKGNISVTRIYNRTLSASEVLQNYNATKGRYI